MQKAHDTARGTGARIEVTGELRCGKMRTPFTLMCGPSMGQESEAPGTQRGFCGYEVNAAMMARAKPQAIFLHCLPAHRGEEVAAEVIDGPQSRVFDQGESFARPESTHAGVDGAVVENI
ncbi:MAG: hypothetical protein R3C68_14735 [Myxococcota bacterium]